MSTNIFLNKKYFDEDDIKEIEELSKTPKKRKSHKVEDHKSYYQSKHPHHLRRRKRSKPEEPIYDIWTILPLILACFLFVASILLYNKKNKPIPYCSSDTIYEKCIPCPEDATCHKGVAKCNHGYKFSGKVCVTDVELNMKAMKLAIRMGKFIASNPNEFCNASLPVTYTDLSNEFSSYPVFDDAINRISSSDYDIHITDGYYISLNPILDMKCKVFVFAEQNKTSLALVLVAFVLILVLFISIRIRISTRKAVKVYAKKIVEALKRDKSGEMHHTEEFEPMRGNRLLKHWDEVVDEVETYACIDIFNTKKGKMWKYNHSNELDDLIM
ncbi:hypothetical protein TRFO_39172 [Tritrichomonas foetus]|uniref:Man1/Src1 C-terminal domain-containing protein n=1 Tax=Tritrichomonas foetus TaxID=1144522 RepID=A0A1J4J615_9EUKA|nr:hypothetical protein TRFO_39172 [Tritrichomonas foetus]|eukprot:OHS94674.1 hypothetical protein TRFO_39172 [Tritrichomonas foetus]